MAPEDIILGLLDGAATFNFTLFFEVLFVCMVLVWLMVVVWVWKDATSRSDSILFNIFSVLMVLFLNIFGLIIYLLIRPKEILDDLYWAELERRYLLYETEDIKDCIECGYQLRPGFNLCPHCGTSVRIACEECEEMINVDWPYCPYCGKENSESKIEQVSIVTPSIDKSFLQSGDAATTSTNNDLTEVEEDLIADDLDVTDMEEGTNVDESLDQTPYNLNYDPEINDQVDTSPANRNGKNSNLSGIDRLGKKVMIGVVAFGGKIHSVALSVVRPLTTPISQNENLSTHKKDTDLVHESNSEIEDSTNSSKDLKSDSKSTEEVKDKQAKKDKKRKGKKNKK